MNGAAFHSILEVLLEDAWHELRSVRLQPWEALLDTGNVECFDANGRHLHFQSYDHSAKEAFWASYIDPFLLATCRNLLREMHDLTRRYPVAAKACLDLCEDRLELLIRTTFAVMVDIDFRLGVARDIGKTVKHDSRPDIHRVLAKMRSLVQTELNTLHEDSGWKSGLLVLGGRLREAVKSVRI